MKNCSISRSTSVFSLLLLGAALVSPLSAQNLERKVADEIGLAGATPQTGGAAKATNLFSGAKVKVSGHFGTDTPEKAIDGKVDPNSFWGCENIPVTYEIDMGQAKSLQSIKFWPYWKDGRIYQYKIEGSADGKKWDMLVDQRANSISGTEAGSEFSFPAQIVRFVRVTFTKNSLGNTSGGHIVEIMGFAEPQTGNMTVTPYDSLHRLAWTGKVNAPAQKGINLSGWRGERVNAQILVSSDTKLEQLRVTASKLTNKSAAAGTAAPKMNVNFVKFTKGGGAPQADIISSKDGEYIDNPAGVNRTIWVSIDVPRNAETRAFYEGEITVSAKGEKDQKIPVFFKASPNVLPAAKDWDMHVDLWQYPDSVARYHGVELWSDEHFAIMRPLMKRLADAGQKVITASIMHEAWGGQTYDHFPSMVKWTRKKDGSMTWDYSVFDKWVTFMIEEIGIKDQISCYTMIPWSMKLRVFDEATGNYVDLPCNPGTPEYEKLWAPFLKDFTKHVKAKGWLDITGIGIDERPDHMVRAAHKILAENAPQLKVVSAVNSPSAASGIVYDMSPIITHTETVTDALLAQRQKEAKKTTFYVCVHPARPNTFTASPLHESEWLGMFAAVQDFDGFLRWAYNAWNRNPLETTKFGNWPDGDCYLVYPGNLSSLRFEKLRDGFEEFEKLEILKKKAKSNPALAKAIDAFIKQMKPYFDKTKTGSLNYMDGINAYHKGMRELEKLAK